MIFGWISWFLFGLVDWFVGIVFCFLVDDVGLGLFGSWIGWGWFVWVDDVYLIFYLGLVWIGDWLVDLVKLV